MVTAPVLRSHRIVVPVLHNSTRPVYAACPAAPNLAPGASLAAAATAGCASPELSEGAAFELNNAIPYMVRRPCRSRSGFDMRSRTRCGARSRLG